MENIRSTDFRFNRRILNILELDTGKVRQALSGEPRRKLSSSSSVVSSKQVEPNSTDVQSKWCNYRIHVIQKYDTLESIARLYRMDTQIIRLFNQLKSRKITDITELKIPARDVDLLKLKEKILKEKRDKKNEKVRSFVHAFKHRTFEADSHTAEKYIKQSKGNYYDAVDQYQTDQNEKQRNSLNTRKAKQGGVQSSIISLKEQTKDIQRKYESSGYLDIAQMNKNRTGPTGPSPIFTNNKAEVRLKKNPRISGLSRSLKIEI